MPRTPRNKAALNQQTATITELLKLSTMSGRKYLTVNMLEDDVMEITWEGFTPESIYRAGIDSISEIASEQYPAAVVFNTLQHHGISEESQRYAVMALSEYVKKYFSVVRPDQKFRRIMVVQENTYNDSGATGYFLKLAEARIETIYVRSIEEAYSILSMPVSIFQRS
ncbi:MAG TPA: hypothetical protein VIN08_04210 [Ohtaekwangia sp.]|uniref:hypothetical protein n=1 Tax=Ohtaekwangia sp. TaxID=2066019 RepID=UPI002F9270AF